MPDGPQMVAGKPAGDDEIKILTREEVLECEDLVEETVYVKEWGGGVVIRSFTKGKQIELNERATVDDELKQPLLQMFSFLEGVVNPQFSLDDQEDLKEKNAMAFDRVLKRVFAISGMAASEEEAEAKEAQFQPAPGASVPDAPGAGDPGASTD